MSQYVSTREQEQKRYTLLQPGNYPARTDETGYVGPYQVLATWKHLDWICHNAAASKYLAVDFETKGGDYSADISVVGIGLAWDTGSAYLHWSELYENSRTRIINLLLLHQGLIAHNVYFDGGVASICLSGDIRFHHCTYSLLAHLANEGHPDQSWGLKSAMTELLGWADSNELELDRWLVLNGHYIGNRRLDSSTEYLNSEFEAGGLRPDKSEMWQAPAEILGKYCLLDAEACYLLYTEVLLPVFRKFPGLLDTFQDTMHLIQLLIEQKMHGIPVNRRGLEERKTELLFRMQDLEEKFRKHPDTRDHIDAIEYNMLQEFNTKEPERFKKNGDVSKNWLKWEQRKQEILDGRIPEYNFNIQSGPQLRELLYTRMGFEVRARTENGDPAVGIKTLKHMGIIGQILIDRAYAAKELSYIEDYLARTLNRATIHPSFRTPGTMTGRLSSKEPNVQQIPKSKAVMSLFHARPGHVWIDLDFAALEPVVLTEFSQDEALLRIYGNNAPKNDIYSFVAASIPTYASDIRATGYDPHNPTPEALVRIKQECKSIRSICKTVVLACIAEGELVRIRNKSWIPIEQVKAGDEVWDGIQWVKTEGSVLNGIRNTLKLNGVSMTPEHKVLTSDGDWKEAYEVQQGTSSAQQIDNKPSASWADVWKLVCTLYQNATYRK